MSGVVSLGVPRTTGGVTFTQTYSTTATTVPTVASAAVATTAATSTTPWGFTTAAQADAIRAAVNNLVTDVTNNRNLINAIIDRLQALGDAG